MATPLTADQALAALKQGGVKVQTVGDWRNHNRNHKGAWGPVNGVMLHHSVTRGTQASIDICRNGYSGLPGPLCHGVIDKDGTVYLIGWGRTNHAGLGDPDVLRAVIAEAPLPKDDQATVDGNARFYGFECVNLGDGYDPWPDAQIDAMIKTSAALIKAHGWGKDGTTSVIGHKEWQPGKPDPAGVDMNWIRSQVDALVKGTSPGCACPPQGKTSFAAAKPQAPAAPASAVNESTTPPPTTSMQASPVSFDGAIPADPNPTGRNIIDFWA